MKTCYRERNRVFYSDRHTFTTCACWKQRCHMVHGFFLCDSCSGREGLKANHPRCRVTVGQALGLERFSKRASIGALDVGWLAVEIATEPGNNRQTARGDSESGSPGRIYRNPNLKWMRLFATTRSGLFFFFCPPISSTWSTVNRSLRVSNRTKCARPSLANKRTNGRVGERKKERDNQTWTQFVAVQDWGC